MEELQNGKLRNDEVERKFQEKISMAVLVGLSLAGMASCMDKLTVKAETEQETQESAAVEKEILESCTSATSSPYGEPVQIKTTAYCSCKACCGHNHGITKSGRPAKEGLTVASNTYYGKTIVLYDEDMQYIGIYEVMDTGTDGLDIYMDSHKKALEFGEHDYYIQAVDAVG